jgi:hypothetical protein
MIINAGDWVRRLKIASSLGNTAVKFDPDGNFGVIGGRSRALFGKSCSFGQELPIPDVGVLVRSLRTARDIEVNFQSSDGELIIADCNAVHTLLLAPPEMIRNYTLEQLPILRQGDSYEFTLIIEDLHCIKRKIEALGFRGVWFTEEQDKLVCNFGSSTNFMKIYLGFGHLPNPVIFDAKSLLPVLGLLDVSRITLVFWFREKDCILEIKWDDFSYFQGGEVKDVSEARVERQLLTVQG